MKPDATNQYEELHFVAEKGIEYTLQNSLDLATWNNDLKFIGNGELVKLRLFALNNSVQPQNGNSSPYSTVSLNVRKVDSGGTFVSWVSLEDQTVKHAYFSSINLNQNFPSTYIGLKQGYYLFLSLESFTNVSPDSPVVGADLAFKNSLSSILTSITNDANSGISPIKPHRPTTVLSKKFWRIKINSSVDSDGDGISNADEIANGTDSLDENNGGDSDEDGIPDFADADPLDKAITWKKVAEVPYVVTDIGLPTGVNLADGWLAMIGDGGHVLLSNDTSGQWPVGGGPPIGAPEKTYFKTYVWDSSSKTWSELLLPNHLRGVGSEIDYEGNVYGVGYGALGPNTDFPGYKETSLIWKRNALGGWLVANTELESELGTDFSNTQGTWTDVPSLFDFNTRNHSPVVFGKTGYLVRSESNLQQAQHQGYFQRLVSPSVPVGPQIASVTANQTVTNYRAAGEYNGWHAATWAQANFSIPLQHYIFSKLTRLNTLIHANPPEGGARYTLTGLTSINANYLPFGIDDIVIWKNETDGFQFGSSEEPSASFSWEPPANADLTKRIDGKINGRGEGLKTSDLWRNGRWTPLDDLVDSALWPNIAGRDFNNAGEILATSGSANKLIIIAPIGVVELSPKLVDENDVVIEGSERPALAPESTEMVERNPLANPQIVNASNVRIAWRDMKVRIGKSLAGTTVTWTMESRFTPPANTQNPGPHAPVFRGKWGAAANSDYRHRFSVSENYGANDFTALALPAGANSEVGVSISATTTVDADGYTAIRVNLPPIGFNKARVKIAIQGVEEQIDLIDIEVPGVIVIDAGHGAGAGSINGSASIGTVALISNAQEHAVAFDISESLVEHMRSKFKPLHKIKVYKTRSAAANIGLSDRTRVARNNGADVFVSLHFNSPGQAADGSINTTLRDPFYLVDMTNNVNLEEDRSLGVDMRIASQNAIAACESILGRNYLRHPNTSENHDVNMNVSGKDVLTDADEVNRRGSASEYTVTGLGNTQDYHPCRAVIIELEWFSHPAADSLFNRTNSQDINGVPGRSVEIREQILKFFPDSLIKNIKNH